MNFEEQVNVLSKKYHTKIEVVSEVLNRARIKPYIRIKVDFNHQAYNLADRYLRLNLYRNLREE
jgi:hypothetical protein